MMTFAEAQTNADRLARLVELHIAECPDCNPLSMRQIDPPMPDFCPVATKLWAEMSTWVDRAADLL